MRECLKDRITWKWAPMAKLKWVTSFTDNRGQPRHRFRRTGFPTHYFQSSPNDPQFYKEYQMCVSGTPPKPKRTIKRKKRPRYSLVAHAKSIEAKFPDAEQFIYFVGWERGPIKIGIASTPHRRIKDIQTGCPHKLRIWAMVPGTQNDEAKLHKQFANDKLKGEWFKRSTGLLAEIETASEFV